MTKLVVRENKKLILKNVIVHELRDISLENVETEIDKFLSKLELLKVQTFGPLVTKNYGTQIREDGAITTNYDIMIQAHDYKQYKKIYKTYNQVTAEYCVYVRFEDHPQYSNYAHTKLELYFYENDLMSDGTTYSVIVNDTAEHLVMDLFQPVKQL